MPTAIRKAPYHSFSILYSIIYISTTTGRYLDKIMHTGDKLPLTVGRDAPRFIHDSTSYVTATHTNHTIHACTAAAMRAATVAMRKYARTRATNHGLLANTALNPPVVPIPTMVP